MEYWSSDFTVTAPHYSNTPLLRLRQAEGRDDALKIVIPVVFDLDLPSFFAVMDGDVRAQMLLQAILQIDNRGGTRARFGPFSSRLSDPKLTRNEPFGVAHGRVAAKNGLGCEQLFLVQFEAKQDFGVPDRQ